VVYTRNAIKGANLVYYDFNGKIIASINTLDLKDDKIMTILYMEAKDDYLYILSNEGIYKLNSNLEEIASNNNIKIDIYSNIDEFEAKDKFYTWSRLDYGIKQMEFTDDGIYLPNKLFSDYNLSEITTVEESNKYIHYSDWNGLNDSRPYEIDELKSSCGLNIIEEYELHQEFGWACDKLDDYIVASGPIVNSNGEHPHVMALYKNNKELWRITNEEYKFIYTKFY
ncbi:MAG: hypothetical protein K2H20_01515, partial [Bacilli bacterium]|nr:hypothetical protein [Bacilli bacterium]